MAVNPAIEAAIRQTAAETGLPEDEIRAMMLGGDTPTADGGDAGAFGYLVMSVDIECQRLSVAIPLYPRMSVDIKCQRLSVATPLYLGM